MLSIICGEDTVTSRKYFHELKTAFTQKGYETKNIAPKDLHEAVKSDQTINLFGSKIIFFTQNLNSTLSKSVNKKLWDTFEEVAKSDYIEIIDWEEDKPLRDLKISKLGKVKEFKPLKNIFQLLDALYPGNKIRFIELLNNLAEKNDDVFIFTMLTRHVRTLLLAQEGEFPFKIQSWQRGKLNGQSKLWSREKLLSFYEGLFRVDLSTKTGSNAYGIINSIEILVCHYL